MKVKQIDVKRRRNDMNTIKFLAITISLTVFLLNSSPSFGNDDVEKKVTNSENILCQVCNDTKYSVLANLKEFISLSKSVTSRRVSPIKKYITNPSPISQDIEHLTHLKEDKGKEIIFFYTLYQF
jgi:hypothetical protein